MESIIAWTERIWGAAVYSSSSEALMLLLIGVCSVLIGAFWRRKTVNGTEDIAEQES